MFKDGGFASHAKSDVHINAMLAWKNFETEQKQQESLMSKMSQEHKKQIEENRCYIKSVAEVLLLTATQNIAQRGHRETVESNNRGNFLAILELLGNHDTVVRKKLKTGNAKYTSHQIQNEMLDTLAEMVRSTIISEVKESQVFALMADETKDAKKKEQISLVLRYYYRGAVKESFLHFEAAEHLDAAGLADKIIGILEKYGLEYRDNLVGQGYDGASVMSGKNSGVQARVREVAKQAFYVHCNAHCLNLVLVDTVKAIPEVEYFFSLVQKLYTFMSGSYVHTKWLKKQKEMYDGAPRELQRLSDTRWACQQKACKTILDRLPAIVSVLEEITEERHGDRSVDARGLLTQIDFQFVWLLVTMTRLFGEARCLSDALQSPNLDLSLAVDLVDGLVQTLKDFRTETHFEELWKEAINTAEQCNIESDPAPKRKKILSKRLDEHSVMCQLGGRPEQKKDNFRTGLFYPVLDHMLTEINRRFSKPNCQVMRGIQALNPTNATFCDEAALLPFAAIYGSNTEDMRHELHQLKRVLERKSQAGLEKPSSVIELTKFIEPHHEVFHEVFRLCKIAVTIPVTTAACERSFSVLKLVKSYLRSTMDDERLSNLGVLSVESKRATSLDMDEFVNQFALNHNNRRIRLL